MKELTCIGCPRGCTLKIERDGDGWSVTGNTCPRGREFAISEMTAPKRTICSTVRTAFPDAPVLPVRVSADIPKDRIFDVMDALKTVTVSERIGRGDVVIPGRARPRRGRHRHEQSPQAQTRMNLLYREQK